MVRFHCQDQSIALAPGQHYAKPRAEGFRDTAAGDLRDLIREISAGRDWRDAVAGRYAIAKPWLYQIIADARRTAFFDAVVPPENGPALDIGSGWGQIARPLAARRPVVALEPVAERLAFIQAAAKQDGAHNNLAYIEADYLDIEFSTRFDLICAIGVLEWTGAFQSQVDPQQRQQAFLDKARRELAPDGSLVLGIENRLGLKYLLGCPDDHLGVPYVACLPAGLAKQRRAAQGHVLQSFTYSQTELTRMLQAAGFSRMDFFAAFPDYKLPAHIISLDDHGQALHARLLAQPAFPEHNGYDGSPLNPSLQTQVAATYRTLAAEGLAWPFVPSFFVRAG